MGWDIVEHLLITLVAKDHLDPFLTLWSLDLMMVFPYSMDPMMVHGLPLPYGSYIYNYDGLSLPYGSYDGLSLPYGSYDGLSLPYGSYDGLPLPYGSYDGLPSPYGSYDGLPSPYGSYDGLPLPYSYIPYQWPALLSSPPALLS